CPDAELDNAIAGCIRPFDPARAPLFRCTLIRTAGGRNVLVADFHHLICDGMSQLILYNDFWRLYHGETLPPTRVQPKDYGEWERTFRSGEEYIAHREFWLQRLEGQLPRLDLPVTGQGRPETAGEGGSLAFSVGRSTLAPLLALYREREITPFSGLFSLYLMFLSQLTGQEDLVVGVAASGRLQEELEDVVGMFVKTLPIRYQLNPEVTYEAYVQDLHKYLVQANSRQLYDLGSIVGELGGRLAGGRGLFETLFVFQNFGSAAHQTGNAQFREYALESRQAKYPLVLTAAEAGEAFTFRLEYQFACFTPADARLLADQFTALLENAARNCGARVASIIDGAGKPAWLAQNNDFAFNF
ncbi:MAG TPA: condensation domain-containing protein, partial [Cytophagales bacterium]